MQPKLKCLRVMLQMHPAICTDAAHIGRGIEQSTYSVRLRSYLKRRLRLLCT